MIELVAGLFALFVVCYQYNQTIRRMQNMIIQLEADKATLAAKVLQRDKQKRHGANNPPLQSGLQHGSSGRTGGCE